MAVSIRKLAPEEVQRVFPGRGQQDLPEYVAALRELHPGETAEIERQGSSDRAIKRRLGAAAKQLRYRLKWSRYSSLERLYFQVIGAPGKLTTGRRQGRAETPNPARPAGPTPEPTAPRAGRARRRRAA